MLTFLIVLMPLSIVFYEFIKREPKDFMPLLIGLLSSSLYCALKAFFTFSHRVVPYSFGLNFIFLFMHQIFLPILIVYVLFFVISKDSIEFKVNSFFPLISSFYAVYLPYIVISANQSTVYPFYEILFKPVIFLCLILHLTILLKFIHKEIKRKKILFLILDVVSAIIFLVLPSIIETMYLLNVLLAVRIIAGVIYCLLPFVYYGFIFVGRHVNN